MHQSLTVLVLLIIVLIQIRNGRLTNLSPQHFFYNQLRLTLKIPAILILENPIFISVNVSMSGWGILPYKRLMEMYQWVGSHFHNWVDQNGAFSIELLEWGRTFSDFWTGKIDFIFTVSKRTRMFVLQLKIKVFFLFFIQSKNWVISKKQKVSKLGSRKLHIFPKVTNMGSIIGHRIDYIGVGALGDQRHILNKKNNLSTSLPPGTHVYLVLY